MKIFAKIEISFNICKYFRYIFDFLCEYFSNFASWLSMSFRVFALSRHWMLFFPTLCTPPFSQIHKFTHKRVWIKTALYNNIFILYIMIKNRTHKDVWKCEKVNFYMHAISLPPLRKTIYRHLFFTFLHKNLENPKCSSYLCTVIQKELVESTQTLRSSFAHRSLIVRLKQSRVYQWTKFIHFQKPKQLCVK